MRKYLPVVISVHALISKITPFGDSLLVVYTIVISTRETGVCDGIFEKPRCAGLLLSFVGLDVDSIG